MHSTCSRTPERHIWWPNSKDITSIVLGTAPCSAFHEEGVVRARTPMQTQDGRNQCGPGVSRPAGNAMHWQTRQGAGCTRCRPGGLEVGEWPLGDPRAQHTCAAQGTRATRRRLMLGKASSKSAASPMDFHISALHGGWVRSGTQPPSDMVARPSQTYRERSYNKWMLIVGFFVD